jgi:hypothetical protein
MSVSFVTSQKGNLTVLVEASKLRAAIRDSAKTTNEAPKVVLADCLESASQSSIVALPRLLHVKRNIGNYRRQIKMWPPLPKCRQDIHLSGMMLKKNIYRLVEALKREQSLTEAGHEQAVAGEPPYKRRKYKDADERLHRAVLAFNIPVPDEEEE